VKQAKQRARQQKIKPRVGLVALLKKGGVHQRKDKRAARALLKARFESLKDHN
jgi:hypothetical protein